MPLNFILMSAQDVGGHVWPLQGITIPGGIQGFPLPVARLPLLLPTPQPVAAPPLTGSTPLWPGAPPPARRPERLGWTIFLRTVL